MARIPRDPGQFVQIFVADDSIKQTVKKINELPRRVNRKVLRSAMTKAVAPLRKAMRQKVKPGSGNTAAEVQKLKELKKDIKTRIRADRKYISRGNVVALVGHVFNTRFSTHPDIPASQQDKPIAAFAKKVEFEGDSYARAGLDQTKSQVFRIYKEQLTAGLIRETKKLGKKKRV